MCLFKTHYLKICSKNTKKASCSKQLIKINLGCHKQSTINHKQYNTVCSAMEPVSCLFNNL